MDIPQGVRHGEEKPGIVEEEFGGRGRVSVDTIKVSLEEEGAGDKHPLEDQAFFSCN